MWNLRYDTTAELGNLCATVMQAGNETSAARPVLVVDSGRKVSI